MNSIYLFLFYFLHTQINIFSSLYSYDLPTNHMPFYFRNFPDELSKCLSDSKCPYKDINEKNLPCWGYEQDCEGNSVYSSPECPQDFKGWVKSKKEQISTFYYQGDFGYVRKHRNTIKVICEPTFKDDAALECSDHLQFCRGRNIFMNLTSLSKNLEPFRYKMDVLSKGNFGGHCYLYEKRLLDLSDHMSPLQSWAPEMRYFTSFINRPIPDGMCKIILEKPAIIMKIDAAINLYHHLCDFLNLYASLHVNMSHPQMFGKDVQVIIWETYPYYSYFKDIWKAFSKNPILTLKNFAGKTVCFKNVVFPLLPRMIFGLYYNTPLVYGCEKSGLFKAFSEFIIHRLRIKEKYRNISTIRVTLLSRQTPFRNILNEEDLIEALKKNQSYMVKKIVFNKDVPFSEQVEIIRNTDIFIGMHGAGLTHLLFLPDWAGLFELYNCEDENCYKDLARLRGIRYITWEKEDKIFKEKGRDSDGRAHAKFTNYAFDVNEFLRLVNVLAQHVILHPQFAKQFTRIKHEEL